MEARVGEDDNGVFFEFPLSVGGDADFIFLQFNHTGIDFLDDGIDSSDIDESQVDTASGTISTGAGGSQQQIAFTIDPASVVVEVEDPAPPANVSITIDGSTIELGWQSVDGISYSVEASTTMLPGSWFGFINVTGDGTYVTRSFTKLNTREFYRVIPSR